VRLQSCFRQRLLAAAFADNKQLQRVLSTAAKIKGRGDLKADDHERVKEAIRRHVERQINKVNLDEVIEEKAAEARVAPADLRRAVDNVWNLRRETAKVREDAKADLRKRSGLTARRISQMEEAGQDYSHHPGFDELTESVISEYPELGISKDHQLWQLLKEGRNPLPVRHDKVILEEALAFLKLSRGGSRSEREELESIPFKKRVALLLGYPSR
jgi:hypothetical protein